MGDDLGPALEDCRVKSCGARGVTEEESWDNGTLRGSEKQFDEPEIALFDREDEWLACQVRVIKDFSQTYWSCLPCCGTFGFAEPSAYQSHRLEV